MSEVVQGDEGQSAPLETLDDIEALLMGEAPKTPPAPAGEPEDVSEDDEGDDETQTKGREDEDEDDETDYSAVIPMGAGREAKTLGELKDYFNQRESQLMEIQERQNTAVKHQVEIDQIMDGIFSVLPPAVKMQGAAILSEKVRRGAAQLNTILPEWRDESTRQAERGLILELAQEYGIGSEAENQLDYPTVPGMIKALRDFAALKKFARDKRAQAKTAKPASSSIKPKQTSSTSDRTGDLVRKAKSSGNEADKQAAIAALLGV